MEAVKNFQMPNSIKKIREFVGLANYFRFLIPHFSENATQLKKLTKQIQDTRKATYLLNHSRRLFIYVRSFVTNRWFLIQSLTWFIILPLMLRLEVRKIQVGLEQYCHKSGKMAPSM